MKAQTNSVSAFAAMLAAGLLAGTALHRYSSGQEPTKPLLFVQWSASGALKISSKDPLPTTLQAIVVNGGQCRLLSDPLTYWNREAPDYVDSSASIYRDMPQTLVQASNCKSTDVKAPAAMELDATATGLFATTIKLSEFVVTPVPSRKAGMVYCVTSPVLKPGQGFQIRSCPEIQSIVVHTDRGQVLFGKR
ncbi:MAG: hypothetical protein EKK41_28390 [Hyphomicrobiales bacterium]|nr:MAG: hypothetical protein EKK41_28390 [Hyphomicrobiales bacterium]